ncbi:MAG: amidohydrolase family protein [Planctomycetes bacterium]|nr:amidohydrolase family protein [Planctomycetota bacterium]
MPKGVEHKTLLCTADRLFDGTGTAALSHPVVRISGERVEAVGTGQFPPVASGAQRFDFPGCTILPGLIDTHVHLVFSALHSHAAIIEQVTGETDAQLLQRALANARAALHAGVTTVRDCGGRGRVIQEVRDCIRRGDAEGADVLACGAPITTRTGHCHWLGLVADTPQEVRSAAERMLAEGADFLKVMATGGNMTPSSDPMRAQYDSQTLTAVADLGRRARRHTAAHVLSQAGLPAAIAARVRTIEHCDWRVEVDRHQFNPEAARRLIDQDQYIGLTMGGMTRRAFLGRAVIDDSGPVRRLDARFACERQMIEFGVPFTLHSDAGVRWTPIDRFALGLRAAVVELCLSPAEAIVAATRTAAEALGLDDRGVLLPGRRADLLVVEGNPLRDPACLEDVRAVMKAGRWVSLGGAAPFV